MKRFLVFPLLMTFPLLLLIFLSIGFGHSLSGMPGDFGKIESCRLPCWNGIQPGRTPFQDATTILNNLGYQLEDENDIGRLSSTVSYKATVANGLCQVGLGRSGLAHPIVADMTLRFCGGAFLGHIIDLLGEPETILPIVSMVNYRKGEIAIILRSPMCSNAPSPRAPLLFISVSPSQIITGPTSAVLKAEEATGGDSDSTNLPWRGFIPVWRYDQLFPGRAIC